MAHPNAELVQRAYDAFDKSDTDAMRSLMADDIVFHVPGRSQIAGDYRGQDEVFGFFGKLVELTGGTFKLERHAVLADDEHGTVLSTATGERNGKSLSLKGVDVFHFAGGRVSEFWGLVEDQYAEDEFFS